MAAPDTLDEDIQRRRDLRQSDGEWRLFLDTAIHDLRARLRGANTSAELLSETVGEALPDTARQLIQRTLDNLHGMDSLLRALTEYTAVLEGDSKVAVPVPLSGVVRSAVETLQPLIRETGASLHYDGLRLSPAVGNSSPCCSEICWQTPCDTAQRSPRT